MTSKFLRRSLCTKAKAPNIIIENKNAPKNEKGEGPKKEVTLEDIRNIPELNEKIDKRSLDCKEYQLQVGQNIPKRVNVTLCGSLTRAGKLAALLLAHNPLIKKLYLFDTNLNDHLVNDLKAIDKTACFVKSYCGKENFESGFRAADIAVLIDTDPRHKKIEKKFIQSYSKVKEFAKSCSMYCPRAVLIVGVDPLSCTVPLVQSLMESTPWSHPSKLIGNITDIQSALNTVAAKYLNLNPATVHVPLLGGPDADSIVPVVSQMTPDPGLSPRDQVRFYHLMKTELVKINKQLLRVPSTINQGYAIATLVANVAKGLCGQNHINGTVFIRTNIAPQIRFLVSTVKFGLGGIVTNYGIPKLTPFEFDQLLCAINILNEREKMFKHLIDDYKSAELCA